MTSIVPLDAIKKSLGESAREYQTQLIGSDAEAYLLARGLTNEVLDSFQIGFVSDPRRGDDLFRGMISIPFLTPTGVVAMKYRRIDDKQPRFLASGTTKRFFNSRALLAPHRIIYLCEGEVDTMTVSMLHLPVVGMPGVGTWERKFARAFRNRKVVVLADGDDDGQGKEFANRIRGDVEDADVILFEGEDVNSYLQKYSLEKLREKILG